ncbi:MAG TPA: hypothetical protein VMB75_04570 [Rhodocyclaceae bacterium]|nr:hypothetical protein [Rhodocyclaceae bacterium]
MTTPGKRCPLIAALAFAAILSAAAAEPDRFNIFIATLDGRGVQCLVSDPRRELNHARVSPDGQWITFTRYNKRGFFSSVAKEEDGYEETEIMLAHIDGRDPETLVPPRKDLVAANSYWSENGKAILFVSNDNPRHRGQINRIDLATRTVTKVPIAGDPWAADPHRVGDQLAISVFEPEQKQTAIWLAAADGSRARQITFPGMAGKASGGKTPLGDFDPKISPDGRRVATMRHLAKDSWHVIVVDLASGGEQDISPARAVDGVPEWSGDGSKLVFWHVNVDELRTSGLYTMNPDGSDRRRLPLPHGYFYTLPAFFPGEGAKGEARIIFSGEKNPFL